jgi:hypothetical protein
MVENSDVLFSIHEFGLSRGGYSSAAGALAQGFAKTHVNDI